MSTAIAIGVLAMLLAAASACDLHARRIPNALVVSGGFLGLGLQVTLPAGRGFFEASAPGSIGLSAALLALGALLAAGVLLWRVGLFGSGDAKLLAAVGSFVGPSGVLPVLLYTLLAGGVLAVLASLAQPWRAAPTGPLRLPYALAIACGALIHALPGTVALFAAPPAFNPPPP